ncbi:MAG: hypothetical protein V7459_05485 [Oceanicoccus sp.]
MPSAFLEIVQLASGEIVLRNSDGEGEPLVNIRFSAAAKDYIGDSEVDIAKVMIQAGIQAAAHINEARVAGNEVPRDSEEQILH